MLVPQPVRLCLDGADSEEFKRRGCGAPQSDSARMMRLAKKARRSASFNGFLLLRRPPRS